MSQENLQDMDNERTHTAKHDAENVTNVIERIYLHLQQEAPELIDFTIFNVVFSKFAYGLSEILPSLDGLVVVPIMATYEAVETRRRIMQKLVDRGEISEEQAHVLFMDLAGDIMLTDQWRVSGSDNKSSTSKENSQEESSEESLKLFLRNKHVFRVAMEKLFFLATQLKFLCDMIEKIENPGSSDELAESDNEKDNDEEGESRQGRQGERGESSMTTEKETPNTSKTDEEVSLDDIFKLCASAKTLPQGAPNPQQIFEEMRKVLRKIQHLAPSAIGENCVSIIYKLLNLERELLFRLDRLKEEEYRAHESLCQEIKHEVLKDPSEATLSMLAVILANLAEASNRLNCPHGTVPEPGATNPDPELQDLLDKVAQLKKMMVELFLNYSNLMFTNLQVNKSAASDLDQSDEKSDQDQEAPSVIMAVRHLMLFGVGMENPNPPTQELDKILALVQTLPEKYRLEFGPLVVFLTFRMTAEHMRRFVEQNGIDWKTFREKFRAQTPSTTPD